MKKQKRTRRPNFTKSEIKRILVQLAALDYGEQVGVLEATHIFPSQICRWRKAFGRTGSKIKG